MSIPVLFKFKIHKIKLGKNTLFNSIIPPYVNSDTIRRWGEVRMSFHVEASSLDVDSMSEIRIQSHQKSHRKIVPHIIIINSMLLMDGIKIIHSFP